MRAILAIALLTLPLTAQADGTNLRDLTQLDMSDTAFAGQDWRPKPVTAHSTRLARTCLADHNA